MNSRISFSGKGAKNTAKTQLLSPFRGRRKKRKFLDLTVRGKSNDIAHGSIIQAPTALFVTRPVSLQLR